MIFLLGASGYMGQAFARELERRNWPFKALSRASLDGTRFDALFQFLRDTKPAFLINAAGYTGRPNVDACELARAETLLGNLVLPITIAQACQAAGIPWGHVSSGCIYAGAKVTTAGVERLEKDLTQPHVRSLLAGNPGALHGFTEEDAPNFSFRQPPCSFYSGSKALAEEAIADAGQCYLWRLRIPFDEFDSSKNFLTKIQRYPRVYDNINSLSHRGDFVRACLDSWERRASFGIYNVTNPGYVTTRQVVGLIEKFLRPGRAFEFFASDEEFYQTAAKTPRSNCVLDAAKLQRAGVTLRPVEDALADALKNWRPAAA
jgi:dTDP-4-dehydrorhamnose reductase